MALPTSPSATFPNIVASPVAPGPSNSEGEATMSGSMNWEPVRQKLLGSDLNEALKAAMELREGIEIVHTVEFPLMLSALLPAFSTILAHKTNPSPDTSKVEHKLRNTVLEIISRMPSNEILRPHAPHLIAVALDILNRDYEENALIASRIMFDLYKVYRSLPQDYVQPYLDFVQNSYRSLPTSVQRNFLFSALAVESPTDSQSRLDSPMPDAVPSPTSAMASGPTTPIKSPPVEAPPEESTNTDPSAKSSNSTSTPQLGAIPSESTPGPSQSQTFTPETTNPSISKIPVSPVPRLSQKSTSSFRVLTECPLVVMLMFQLYPKFLRGNIPALINVMMEALALRAPPVQSIAQGKETLDSSARRLYFSRCRELVAAQAKTLSFLTYLLRGFSNDLKPYEDRLASNVVALMSTCPREFVSTRKELLVATRHLLNSDFRSGFFRHVDALLDERVLIGVHHRYSDQTVLRPLGYTTLSDLIHHVRAKLNLNQISRVISIFARVLHDSSLTLPISTQYTAVRTLLSVVDIAFQNKDRNPQIGRDILVRVLKTLVEKLSCFYTAWQKASEGDIKTDLTNKNEAEKTCQKLGLPPSKDPHEALRDFKSMIRAIVVGHKTVIWYINGYRAQRDKEKIETLPPPPGSNEEVSSALLKITHTEHALITRYIEVAYTCIGWLKSTENMANDRKNDRSSTEAYRDSLTYFAAAFTTLDGIDLRKSLGRNMEGLVDAITEDSTVLVVPRHLLAANATTSFEFCTLLLNYLMKNIHRLSTSSEEDITFIQGPTSCEASEMEWLKCSSTMKKELPEQERMKCSTAFLQLFERILKSLTSFPENEKALRPHLRTMVSVCLQASMEKATFSMDNYCMLLRYIFRSISAGKFEESYKELLPLIPTVLNGLYRVFQATDCIFLRQTIIELLLTIPARLSSLLPHMNLLLRVIISALESESGDLVNLGLRTLEFWIDNLNPEFLFPELSKQKDLFVLLMKALSKHLRPAPYQYGLLTLRLLGKLGGKNRKVLCEPMEIMNSREFHERANKLTLDFCWLKDGEDNAEVMTAEEQVLNLPIPIERCIEVLRYLVGTPSFQPKSNAKQINSQLSSWDESDRLWEIDVTKTDFAPYCRNVMKKTKDSQLEAATNILQTAMMKIVGEVPTETFIRTQKDSNTDSCMKLDDTELLDMQTAMASFGTMNHDLRRIAFGLMLSCAIPTQSDSKLFLEGLLTHLFLFVQYNHEHFLRIDANGALVVSTEEKSETDYKSKEALELFFPTGLGSLQPFGYFQLQGPLSQTTNPLSINGAIAQILCEPEHKVVEVGLKLVEYLCDMAKRKELQDDLVNRLTRGSLVFFENLLSCICETCISSTWNRRQGLFEALSLMIEKIGPEWGRKYEVEIMHTVLFSLKDLPRELSMAEAKAFRFVVRTCDYIYGQVQADADEIIKDCLNWKSSHSETEKTESSPVKPTEGDQQGLESSRIMPCDAVFQILLIELASTKQILRLASRYIIWHYVVENRTSEQYTSVFTKHLAVIKRILFSRSLRLLPLPEQVGVVEALGFIVDRLPNLIPLTDQHLLAFLSELLKMSSVADGEMTDPNLGGSVVDKNGKVIPAHECSAAAKRDARTKHYDPPSSALFLRRDCILQVNGKKIHIETELPSAIQLRVSSILLLRAVIRGHADAFFDAESSTPIGNIRPHVISLLFRSLVAFPLKSVTAAHDALRDVLTLSVVSEGGKSKSRLRKELLQTCIRPVLLNLRDYTRLSVHLLRGLSRLLSLLSSWFNKTLGEKLLDHLQKWADPSRMKTQKIWREGEEPSVAAAIIDLFVLLPHASHFVEPLVKTTIKLEACLPVFKSQHIESPFRKPLARYLNKHCQFTVSFFLQRLKTPLYSEMFQEIISFEQSGPLREYLSSRQCSVTILNVCFERPLAIIRSEKKAVGPGSPPKPFDPKSLLSLHGIHPFRASPTQRELLLKQDLEAKKKKLLILQQEVNRTKDVVSAKSASGKAIPGDIDEAKRKQRIAKTAFDRGSKEFNEAKQKLLAEVAQAKVTADRSISPEKGSPRPMAIEALELQNQGFRLIQTLISHDKNYLKNNNDVLRAFRWLWRSKGRYLRLQHEDSVPPRYHLESKLLARILVDYSNNNPQDVDLLFELIRIFLQATSDDFAFVRRFLADAVSSLSVEQKKQIIERLFALLSGESTEEIKTLSMQLVVYPMFEASFKESTGDENRDVTSFFIDDLTTKRFVKEVLFKNGKIRRWGDRLKVELLKMTSILLEYTPSLLESFSEEIVQFCWAELRGEEMSCKSWAYLVLCRHIASFPSPSKIILQVYGALMRSHQTDGKEVVRAALDVLIPTFSEEHSAIYAPKAIEYTNRLMFEEVNSIPQLAHIWQSIVDHPSIFFENRHQFVRYIVNSLTRLGLPPNAAQENRVLSLQLVELVLSWFDVGNDGVEEGKRKAASSSFGDDGGNMTKRRKLYDGVAPVAGSQNDYMATSLDQNMVETIANFLLRMKILIADPKLDNAPVQLEQKASTLFKEVLSRWPRTHLRSGYLDKVASMCRDLNVSDRYFTDGKISDSKSLSKGKLKGKGANITSKGDETRSISPGLVLACMEIFLIVSENAPANPFLQSSTHLHDIITSSFHFARNRENFQIRNVLKAFIIRVNYANAGREIIHPIVTHKVHVLLERLVTDSKQAYKAKAAALAQSYEQSRHGAGRGRNSNVQEEKADDDTTNFALDAIRQLAKDDRSTLAVFSTSLLDLLTTVVKGHASVSAAKQKQEGTSFAPQNGICTARQMHKTSTCGILDEMLSNHIGNRVALEQEHDFEKELKDFSPPLRAAVTTLELFAQNSIVFSFSRARRTLFQALNSILDSSTNLQLLFVTIRIVSRWLLIKHGSPLTNKERSSFAMKIASFDFNGLMACVAQPLADLISQYVVLAVQTTIDTGGSSFRLNGSDEIILGRALVSCLMTANAKHREVLLSYFVSSTLTPNTAKRRYADEILWALLHCDLEGLGARNWNVLFVDLLLLAVVPGRTYPEATKGSLPALVGQNSDECGKLFIAGPAYKVFASKVLSGRLNTNSKGYVESIRLLQQADSMVSQEYLENLLPAAWKHIANDETRQSMIAPFESLLSRNYHSQCMKVQRWNGVNKNMNAIRAFLNGMMAFSPLPMLDSNLLVSLAESYNCWYEVLSILEHQHVTLSAGNKMKKAGEILPYISHCYRRLGEKNMVNCLSLQMCELPQSNSGASLALYGKIDEALRVYSDLVEMVESDEGPELNEFEASMVEDKWVALNREQCQTTAVAEFADMSQNNGLMLESAWKQREWDRVRKLCSSAELVAEMEMGEPTVKLCETLLAVADGKLSDVENLHAQTAQLCLHRWQLLPDIATASMSHSSLLHFFHRLVEIRESGQIMVETSNHSNGKTLPDLKNLLNAWRYRLPNDHDELAVWDEIFTWRGHMFKAITSNFSWSEPSILATLHDRPWTAIRMSMTARKQGMRETSMLLLNRLTDNRAMDVSDAYFKLREQILFYKNADNELERTGGLNLINTTNLSFFDSSQKSELFRLKAVFLSSLRRTSKSNQAYCHSVQICPTHAKAWRSWGGLCSSLGALTEKQTEQMTNKAGMTSNSIKEAKAASSKKVAQYLAQAMGCYLEAIQIDRSEKNRMYLPKCLWILTKDGSSPGVLCQTIENRGTKLPPWVWLPWIPQLLTGLCRIEGRAIKSILTKVVRAYPQAVYYSLRAFYLERRDVERAKGVSATSTQHMPSVAYAEEMMSTLRRSHASLWSSLEAILEELIVKFRPSYEEELLATISALLERAESHAEKQCLPDKTRIEDEKAMVASWSKTLSRIASKFFREADSSPNSSRRDERVKKTADFKRKYKVDFERDFKVSTKEESETPSSPVQNPPFKLSEYIARLQAWKWKLEAHVACTPAKLPLIESSHSLAMFVGESPDIWPGACDTKYLSATSDRNEMEEDDALRSQTSTSSSAAIARKAAMTAALSASSAAAREGVGGEYGGGSAAIEIPGQYCPNSSTSADVKPCPEIHAKLIRFEPFVEVLRRNDQLVRRVSMMGSDGRIYRFLLQFAIPYWTRTDERTAQTMFVVDKFLRQDVVSTRNHLAIRPCATIPVAQRLRMTLDTPSRVSLDEVFRSSYDPSLRKLEALPEKFSKMVSEKLKIRITGETSQSEREQFESTIRKEVYMEIRTNEVDSRILLNFLHDKLQSAERLYAFRRAFAGQLAANSLLQYVFSVTERTPQRFVFVQSNAQLLSPDFRISYSNQGFIENLVVPFRLTPNVETVLGKTYIESRFLPSMAMVSDAIHKHREEFDPILRLLMRDDILAWYSKSLAKTDSKTQELERQLLERVAKNVAVLNARLSECAPSSSSPDSGIAIDSRVKELCEEATNVEKLAMMPTQYHAWL